MVPTATELSMPRESPALPKTLIKVIRDKERELHFTKYPFCLIPGSNHYEPVLPHQSKLALICAGPAGFLGSWNSWLDCSNYKVAINCQCLVLQLNQPETPCSTLKRRR